MRLDLAVQPVEARAEQALLDQDEHDYLHRAQDEGCATARERHGSAMPLPRLRPGNALVDLVMR
jgi:hypothetical protein